MNKTRIVFFVIIGIAVLIIAAGLVVTQLPSIQGRASSTATPRASAEDIQVRIVTALPVEPWVNSAAKAFNDGDHRLDGRRIQVTIIPMDGLTAMGYYEREEMDPMPTAWIPDSRYLVDLVNAVQ